MPFGMEKLEWLEDTFIRFDRMYEHDRHTQKQTNRHRMMT